MKKHRVYQFFERHLGTRFSTTMLHNTFGTAVRTRISEINRDPGSEITIRNWSGVQCAGMTNEREVSEYWSELRRTQ
jgi:hypothetical protein